jgi:NADH-quinone oxidoreductase subunit K
VTLPRLLVLSFAMFAVGTFGVLARRHVIAVLLSIELMFNAANLAIVSAAWAHGLLHGVVVVFFAIAVTVAEVAVGLALFVLAHRLRGTNQLDDLNTLRG